MLHSFLIWGGNMHAIDIYRLCIFKQLKYYGGTYS